MPLDGVAARTGSKRMSIVVYAVAGLSIVGAAVVAAYLSGIDRGVQPLPAVGNTAATLPPSTLDPSTMTPRQAADRLFNRVMSATERGDMEEAVRFAPMAVSAYDRVTNLDLDVRYHLGRLHLILDDLDQARRQTDLLKQNVPRHLLALVLEHDIAVRAGDEATADRAAAEFAAAYIDEMMTARPEYAAHKFAIDQFRNAGAAPEVGSAATFQPAAAAGGETLFESRCAECHGREAKGTDKGPPLVHRIYEPSHHGDDAFYRAVREGVRGHHWPFGDMPPPDEDVTRIVAYVRALQKANGIE
jgi:mono/diheme cytochrome c family protein